MGSETEGLKSSWASLNLKSTVDSVAANELVHIPCGTIYNAGLGNPIGVSGLNVGRVVGLLH